MIIPKHLFDAYTRRQVARRADQPQAGRHRPVQVRRLQAGRHGARRDQPQLPRCRTGRYFDTHRDEGRRRRGLGGARGAADRRVRLRLEHAGRGRDPAAAGEGRQGPRRHRPRRQHRAHPAQHRPTRGPRSTASARASRPSTRSCPTRRCARRSACWSTAQSVQEHIYGRTGIATGELPQQPGALPLARTRSGSSTSTRRTQLLDAAGWKQGADGIREKDGKKLKFVYQTSINAPRQKNQAIVKQACQKAGIDIELKSVDGLGVLLLRRRQPRHLHASSTATSRCTRRP